jgi:hypothetical protein
MKPLCTTNKSNKNLNIISSRALPRISKIRLDVTYDVLLLLLCLLMLAYFFFFFFGGTGIFNSGPHSRQVLYHLSSAPALLCFNSCASK